MAEREARTCCGAQVPVPSFDCYVAGTSCKDFSGLRSRHRQDLEDKGTSGQTFFAAVEVLPVHMPVSTQFPLFFSKATPTPGSALFDATKLTP